MADANSQWSYPGARWWKFDFHTHTPASLDTPWSRIENEAERLTPKQWLLRFMEAEVDCVAVTDHNASEWIDPLKDAYGRIEQEQSTGFRPLRLFPGVELSVNGGFHLLVIFDRGATGGDVRDLLARVEYEGTHGDCDEVTRKSAAEVVEIVSDLGALAIPAHIDGSKGLLQTAEDGRLRLDANSVRQVIDRPEILAAEAVESAWAKHQVYVEAGRAWTEVLGSDCHSFRSGTRPGERYTWVKMGDPSLEGLRLALLDGAPMSVLRSDADAGDPNQRPRLAIEAVDVRNARCAGRGEALRARFSPWMSTIVGGRGAGKSTIVEMLRLGLDRAGELPERLRDEFEQFATVPASRDDRGALRDDTTVTVIYRKDGGRFRVRWRGGDASIEEQNEAGEWRPSPGDVQGRFPVRIFSQKQVFELAADPGALLRLVDDASPVERAEQERRRLELEARYLSLRSQVRELEARLAERSRVEGELADVKRQLAVFEAGGNQALLVEFKRRRRQQREQEMRTAELNDFQTGVRRLAEATEPSDVREEVFDRGNPAEAELLALVEELGGKQREFMGRLNAMADEAAAFLDRWRTRVERSAWKSSAERTVADYEALVERLAAEGVADPASYGHLVQRRHVLESDVNGFAALRARVDQLQAQAARVLEEMETRRIALPRMRMTLLENVLAGNNFVAMTVVPFGKDAVASETGFRESLGRQDEHLQQDVSGILADLYRGLPAGAEARIETVKARVAGIKAGMAKIVGGGRVDGRTKWFHNHVRALRPEQIDRFMCWWPEDGLQVRYKRTGDDRFVPIEHGSPGQKSAAILAFLLSHGGEPIVLDQPEDDLDNHLIYDLIVRQIRADKRRRQIVLATHNPNIVVNGDAEMVISMDQRSGQCSIVTDGSGCLQDPGVRKEICHVMEGGRQAFERRYQRLLEGPRHA